MTTTGTAKTFEYDADGNLRFEKQPDGTVIREYRWDQQNRLVRAIIGTHESVYSYDGESRRVRIQELESGTQTKDETFIWCGSRICQKRSGSTVERNYFKEGFEESGTDYLYTRDHLGSVREVVGSDGTTVASRVTYDPWGKGTESGSGSVADFRFTNQFFDRPSELGLTWYRGYDSNLARWLSKDPIGLRGGLNLYAYVNNDPANFIDPDGHGMFLYLKCVEGMKDAPAGFPTGLIICWPWLSVPDPPAEFPGCAQYPALSSARDICCSWTCGFDPKNRKATRPRESCAYRDADADRLAESCYDRCMAEEQRF